MSRSKITASVVWMILAVLLTALIPTPADADPPGPTDYRTDVIAIEPPTPAITVASIGGDSFLLLTVEPGHEVEVVGYRGEPYLRFGADGIVVRNENSPSRWLNDDRYGESTPPPTATADAEPDWVVVSTSGSYAWHDHRTHWMNPQRPPGAEAGDTVLEAVVPLVVDDVEVDIAVRSVLLARPSPTVAILGLVIGLASVAIGWVAWRRVGLAAVVGGWSVIAVAVGALAYRAVPPETEPSRLIWLLPLIAAGSVAGGLAAKRRGQPVEIWSISVLAAGVELVLWAWLRRLTVSRAFLPTDAPFWLDRAAVAASAAVGLATVALLLSTIVGPAPPPELAAESVTSD